MLPAFVLATAAFGCLGERDFSDSIQLNNWTGRHARSPYPKLLVSRSSSNIQRLNQPNM